MCNQHDFIFDMDQAYMEHVVRALESSPEHPLSAPSALKKIGVYALYDSPGTPPVYVGVALNASTGVSGRLGNHGRKIAGRVGINLTDVSCRYLTIDVRWQAARAEDALIAHYDPPWNKIQGFGSNAPGGGRPGMPGYMSGWDQKFPPRPGTPDDSDPSTDTDQNE